MKRNRFESYSAEFKLLANTSPMLVSVTKNPDDETEEQFISTHDHFIELDEITKNKLAAPETAVKVQRIGKSFNLNITQMSDVARVIRSYYFGEIQLENFPLILSKEMGIAPETAKEISNIVIQKIINDNSQQKAYEAQLAKLTLSDALKKFPDLGEQLITSTHINLKSFPEPVRPSIKNWLFDYTFNMGHDSHNSMTRGQYLFQNANAKALSAADRQKLEYVLKTYDENMIVTVNVNTKQLVFPDLSRNTKHEARSTEDTNQNILNTKYQIPDTHSEPVDIFQREKENEQKYFSGTVVKNRQWLRLPESRNTKHETRNTDENNSGAGTGLQPVSRSLNISPNGSNHNNENNPPLKSNLKPQGPDYNPAPAPSSAIRDTQLEFSSPHKMPYEKQTAIAPKFQPAPISPKPQPAPSPVAPKPQLLAKPAPRPVLTPAPAPTPVRVPQPLRITPSGMQRDFSDEPAISSLPSKNIVNLKE